MCEGEAAVSLLAEHGVLLTAQTLGGRHGHVVETSERHVFLSDTAVRALAGIADGTEEALTDVPEATLDRVRRVWEYATRAVPERRRLHARLGRRVRRMPRLVWTANAVLLLVGTAGLLARSTGAASNGPEAAVTPPLVALAIVCLYIHELGHLLTCVGLGAPSRGIRVKMLGPFPALATHVSGAWRLSRRERILVAMSGPLVSLGLGGALRLLAEMAAGHWPAFSTALGHLATSNYQVAVLSLMPTLRMDGYFVLSHAIGLPNLAQRSRAALRVVWRRGRAWQDVALAAYAVFCALFFAFVVGSLVVVTVRAASAGSWSRFAVGVLLLGWFAGSAIRRRGRAS